MRDAYTDFDLQYIAGKWQKGSTGRALESRDPFNGALLVSIDMAGRDELDAADAAARKAQVGWAEKMPAERAAVMRKAVAIFDARRDEIVEWLIREAGSTRIKAEIEWGLARTITEETIGFP